MINDMMKEFHDTYEVEMVQLDIPEDDEAKEEYVKELDKFLDLRGQLICEEIGELGEAHFKMLGAIRKGEGLEEARKEYLDAIGDIIYVAAGSAHLLGMNTEGALDAIHVSNMSKLGEDGKPMKSDGTDGKPVGKILKGPNFKEPELGEYV